MHNLVKWFKDHNFKTVVEGSEKLTEELGIKVKEYKDEGLYVLTYSQINSPKTHPVVIECRGLIVDNNLNLVCYPFDRFFNLGEAPEVTKPIDYTTATFYEKADGSLVKVYYYNKRWHVATRGTAFAESENYTGQTFQSLILKAFGCRDMDVFQETMKYAVKHHTHIFEYTSPQNRIITPYKQDKMVLLGIRNVLTGECFDNSNILNHVARVLKSYGNLNVRAAKSYKFTSEKELLQAVQTLPDLQEGFVCVDKGVRTKIKSDLYVKVHKLRGETIPTPKRIATLVVTNETEEYLAYFPEDHTLFQPYIDCFKALCYEAQKTFELTNQILDQKEFALLIKDKCYSGCLFTARKNNTDFLTVFTNMDISTQIKILLTYNSISN